MFKMRVNFDNKMSPSIYPSKCMIEYDADVDVIETLSDSLKEDLRKLKKNQKSILRKPSCLKNNLI